MDAVDPTIDDLVDRARALAVPGERHLLGITGAAGAGKSTVAAWIVETLGPELAVLVPMDGFHLANDVLVGLGSRDRKGAPDTFDDGGYANLLGRLRHQTSPTVYAPRFDRDLEEPIAGAIAVHAVVPLVVTEGNYLLLDRDAWPRVRQALDEVWHLRVSEGVRLERLVRRHVRHGKSPADADAWARGTDQRNAELIESCAGRADRVVYLDY